MIGFTAIVQKLPVGHDNLAEQSAAKRIDECLLVSCIQDRLPILYQRTECQQHHIHHQDAADGYLYPCAFGGVADGQGDAVRLPASYAQQLQQRYEQYDGESRCHPLYQCEHEYEHQLPGLVLFQQSKSLNNEPIMFHLPVTGILPLRRRLEVTIKKLPLPVQLSVFTGRGPVCHLTVRI